MRSEGPQKSTGANQWNAEYRYFDRHGSQPRIKVGVPNILGWQTHFSLGFSLGFLRFFLFVSYRPLDRHMTKMTPRLQVFNVHRGLTMECCLYEVSLS